MENEGQDFINDYKDRTLRYVSNQILLMRLRTVSKMSKLVAMAVKVFLLAILSGLILLFISFMGGFYFSGIFDSKAKGFGLIALIYLVLFLLIVTVGRTFFKKKITSMIIDVIFEKTSKENVEDGTK